MAETRVVHLGRESYDIYIGREYRRGKYDLDKSPWRNHFEIGKDGDRAEVIAKYADWLPTQPQLIARLPELRGKVLGCWCAPKPCHGDVLVRLANVSDVRR
jgi:hypothetical protein